jgi:hypothetical protein
MDRRPHLGRATLVAAVLLAACAPDDPALLPPSDRVRAAPEPQLMPTAAFDAALAAGPRDIARIEDESDALAARAAALRARAEALQASSPIPPDEAGRLRAATATGTDTGN